MRGMRQHRQSATFLEIGNAEITYRELIVSVGIVFIMLILGSVIAGNITRDSLEQKKEYNTAISIESENMFDYGIRTNVGNAFCQGALEAVDTVSDSRIDGQWMYIYCEEKHYTMHTRTVTTTDSKGHTKQESKRTGLGIITVQKNTILRILRFLAKNSSMVTSKYHQAST